MNTEKDREKIFSNIKKAAQLLFEANQIAVKNEELADLKSPTCYVCEVLDTIIENLEIK